MNLTIFTVLGVACAFGIVITPNEELYMQLAYIIGLVYSSYSLGSNIRVIILEKNLEQVNLQMKKYYEDQYKKLVRELEK